MAWFCGPRRIGDPGKFMVDPESSRSFRNRRNKKHNKKKHEKLGQHLNGSLRSDSGTDFTERRMTTDTSTQSLPFLIEAEETIPHLTEKIVYEFVFEYMEEITKVANGPYSDESWQEFWRARHTDDLLHMRPTGNPLDLDGARRLFEKGDITDFTDSVVAVESVKILGVHKDVATVVFRSEHEFKYKGKMEDGLSCWTFVIVLDACTGRPKVTNIHRCAGKGIDSVVD